MARPIWKGAISFGLVSIPIQLETAVREKNVSFHLLSKDGSCRLRRKLICPDTGKEINYDDTSRGIEVGKDEYVMVADKELEAIKPEKGKTIDIEQFVDLDEVDPIYFDKVYFITPVEGSSKPYKLLYEAMKKNKRIALARFVMRERQNLAAIRVLGEGLVLHTLHYADEVLDLDDSLPGTLSRAKPVEKELDVAAQLIEAMTKPLDLASYHDDYREQLEKLIERKKNGKQTVEPADDHDDAPPPRTTNLMDALRRSLQGNGGGASKGRAHRTPRRRALARR